MRSKACLLLSLVLLAGQARAQEPSKADMEKAHQAYLGGETAFRLGRYEEAAQKYEEAYRIIKFPTILFDIAQTQRRWYQLDKNVDHLRRALDMYRAFLRDAPTAKQRPIAERLVPELEKTIAAETQRRRAELIAKASGNEGLFLADQLLSEGLVAEASQVLDHVLAARGNPRDVILLGFGKRALVAGTLKQKDVAFEAFKRVLALEPGYLLPEGSDKVTLAAFEEAQKLIRGKRAIALTHVPLGEVPRGRPVSIAFTLESDPFGQIVEAAVFYRNAGAGAFSTVRAKRSAAAIEIPATFTAGLRGGSRIEYYVAALDGQDGELATHGSAKEPFVFGITPDATELAAAARVTGPPPKPAYKKWWVWTLVVGIAAVGAGAGVGLYYGLRPNNPQSVPFPTP